MFSLLLWLSIASAQFVPVRDYSGDTFFDKWDFFDDTDALLTWGNVTYLPEDEAMQQRLTYVNDAGNAIVRVDNFTNVVYPQYRNSIRLESKDYYGVGTVWVFDAVHMPYGCSVWPSFWTKAAADWPYSGEIDIIEYINLMQDNQMAIHSDFACTVPDNQQQLQSGRPLITHNCTDEPGCTVRETKPYSIGPPFNERGGGVYAAQFDVTGTYIWFWSRPDVPESIRTSTSTSEINISDWGMPSASWPSTHCNTAELFDPQQLVITITLCGKWANAGNGSVYSESCPGTCYQDNVLGSGANYANAFFEIRFIRAYSPVGQVTIANTSIPGPGNPSGSASASGGTPVPTSGVQGAISPSNSADLVPVWRLTTVVGWTTGLVLFGVALTVF